MSPAPKVSVLVPTHRYGRFLEAALESVLTQDFRDFEVIVADDASGDGSAEIAEGFARSDPRVSAHVHPRNLGMVENWNWCLGRARGQYVKFLFGDDRLVSKDALGRLAGLLDRHPSASLAASSRQVLDRDGSPLHVRNEIGDSGLQPGRRVAEHALWADRNTVGGPSCVMFRLGLGGRGFDPQLSQLVDLEFWLHLLGQGDLAFEADALCGLRRHPAQQSEANARRGVGPIESLALTARYLPVLQASAGDWKRRLELRAVCHRRLYYARKCAASDPRLPGLERSLRAEVPPLFGAAFWAWHRLSKPFKNLRRFLRNPRR